MPRLLSQRGSGALVIPGVLAIGRGTPRLWRYPETQKEHPGPKQRLAMSEPNYDRSHDDHEGDVYASSGHNPKHLQELQRLSAFTQVTTKVPSSYDGTSSWFAFKDALDDWCDITELEKEKREPARTNHLEGDATIYKRLLDKDMLNNPDEGLKYFRRSSDCSL